MKAVKVLLCTFIICISLNANASMMEIPEDGYGQWENNLLWDFDTKLIEFSIKKIFMHNDKDDFCCNYSSNFGNYHYKRDHGYGHLNDDNHWHHHNHDDAPSVVPVPAAVWLFLSGLLGLVAISRRKT